MLAFSKHIKSLHFVTWTLKSNKNKKRNIGLNWRIQIRANLKIVKNWTEKGPQIVIRTWKTRPDMVTDTSPIKENRLSLSLAIKLLPKPKPFNLEWLIWTPYLRQRATQITRLAYIQNLFNLKLHVDYYKNLVSACQVITNEQDIDWTVKPAVALLLKTMLRISS